MNALRDIQTVFSSYSAIPLPAVQMDEGSHPRALAYLPLVGAFLAIVFVGFSSLLRPFGPIFRGAILVIVPIAATGGIHMDGFMDVSDSLSSWQPMEKRLEILKDVHVGAFAVIKGILYFVALLGVYAESSQVIAVPLACGFVFSRCAAMLMLCTLPNARGKGMLFSFQHHIDSRAVMISAGISAGIACSLSLALMPLPAAAATAAALAALWQFKRTAVTKFGGITGDLAGYCIQVLEMVWGVVIVAAWRIA